MMDGLSTYMISEASDLKKLERHITQREMTIYLRRCGRYFGGSPVVFVFR